MSFFTVNIYHGPCTSFHNLEHRPQRLVGLKVRLQKFGYRVNLHESSYINYCMISMCDHEVFRCNLKHLMFNTHYTRDPVARRAVAAVLAASEKLKLARTNLWFRTLISEEIFVRGPYAPKDYWPKDVEITSYATCRDCVACCEIIVSKKTMREQTISRCYEHDFTSESNYMLNVDVDTIK